MKLFEFLAGAASNEDGKPSGPKTLGLYWGIIAGLESIAGIVAYFKFKQDLTLFSAIMGFITLIGGLMIGKEALHNKRLKIKPEPKKEENEQV